MNDSTKENEMGTSLNTLPEIEEELSKLAYECDLIDHAIVTNIGAFAVALTIDEDGSLTISCQVMNLGQVQEEKLTEFAFAALDANSRISPYAFSLITLADDPDLTDEADYLVVLTDKIPLSDLSECELRSSMQSLQTAILGSRDVLIAGGVGEVAEPAVA